MRIVCTGLLVCFLGAQFVAPAVADDKADAQAIVDKALKALGGEAKLAKFKAQTWNEKGTYYGMGEGLPFTGKYAIQFPDKFRMEIENVFTIVVDGDKGWMQGGGETKDLTKEQLAGQKQMLYGGWVSSLQTIKDKEFTLATQGEIKIDKDAALGVKVSRKGKPDVLLFFDKATGLLAKSEFPVLSDELKGKEVKQETFFSEYKEVDGVKIPMKVVIKREGKVFVEAQLQDVKPLDKVDPKLFAKP
ncbi:MAG: hypothetical protein K2R98_04525 [Gemmataceae bacterium]|nr:hypothetical protein [Gemmataceae bacterium]